MGALEGCGGIYGAKPICRMKLAVTSVGFVACGWNEGMLTLRPTVRGREQEDAVWLPERRLSSRTNYFVC